MYNDSVSVIIPVYNGEAHIAQCLDSLLAQINDILEIVIVDNDSTDDTPNIIAQYTKTHPHKIRYTQEACRSRGAARNRGIACVKGDIIAMTDSDCIVPYNWVRELTYPLIYEHEVITMGTEYDACGTRWTRLIQEQNTKHMREYISGQYVTYLDSKNFAIRTFAARKIQFDQFQKNSEDFEFSVRLRNKYKIKYLPHVAVGHFHIRSLIPWCKKMYDRAYWTVRVYEKHRHSINAGMFPILASLHEKSTVLGLMLHQLIVLKQNPSLKTFFSVITEFSWRLGIRAAHRQRLLLK